MKPLKHQNKLIIIGDNLLIEFLITKLIVSENKLEFRHNKQSKHKKKLNRIMKNVYESEKGEKFQKKV
jgi:hypothetical protein